eukprot:10447613-Ditylum_brightwellii.AAC.1
MQSSQLMKVLSDSSGLGSMNYARALPPNVSPVLLGGRHKQMQTRFLQCAGINLNFEFGYAEWMGQHIAMWPTTDSNNSITIKEHFHLLDDEMKEEYVNDDTYISEIKGAKYEEILPKDVADQQTRLAPIQWE